MDCPRRGAHSIAHRQSKGEDHHHHARKGSKWTHAFLLLSHAEFFEKTSFWASLYFLSLQTFSIKVKSWPPSFKALLGPISHEALLFGPHAPHFASFFCYWFIHMLCYCKFTCHIIKSMHVPCKHLHILWSLYTFTESTKTSKKAFKSFNFKAFLSRRGSHRFQQQSKEAAPGAAPYTTKRPRRNLNFYV